MVGNPKQSEWYNTPKERRVRKKYTIHLSDEARERLGKLAAQRDTSLSEIVEELILAALDGQC